MDVIQVFIDYRNSIGDRMPLYKSVTDTFEIQRALYPGSHVDIMPSFVIPSVIYMDSFKGTIEFFKKMEIIRGYVETNKAYYKDLEITFIEGDYNLKYDIQPVDLIISQFAGFVGQATKAYLKVGGILLCNDSHGDATLAYCDSDYEFVGVVNANGIIDTENLEKYFKFARSRDIDLEKVRKTMKGPNYKTKADNYIFRKNRT
ncbi:hypothetical protein QE109_08375 [Fusibacter bizertensis]|uniref:Uncharacterized protein n=1 Tax=Fusibacter bizertensis TaxID=1488331 RepID=A0ABT6NCR1_9FIRM|nr:hypothetical protein [Fusibacter bizertensis]MDH8678160.1 hypothetical protein [Fusibacter bizertensis]